MASRGGLRGLRKGARTRYKSRWDREREEQNKLLKMRGLLPELPPLTTGRGSRGSKHYRPKFVKIPAQPAGLQMQYTQDRPPGKAGRVVNAKIPLPDFGGWLDDWEDEGIRCHVCGEWMDDVSMGVGYGDGLELFRELNPWAEGGGYRSRGPILWAMHVLKARRWMERHEDCGQLWPIDKQEFDTLSRQDRRAIEEGAPRMMLSGAAAGIGEWDSDKYGDQVPQQVARAFLYPDREQIRVSKPVQYSEKNAPLVRLLKGLNDKQVEGMYHFFEKKMWDTFPLF